MLLKVRVVEAGFEPAKAEPPDLQSGPVGRLGTLPIDQKVASHRLMFFADPLLRRYSAFTEDGSGKS